ncbi:epoxide hydrolase [Nocardioides oleivorans]|uniref:Epoxide hydrolase n=1 Tax=Nocardioides oleivorans TaxID=273676 RepID=A0A4Q2RRP5_9ACTN|nr:epoxide hydrolase family protein [Nocardioides oleivorans]RYB91660.1 epoxide hydrolase [Nocardioides oleivorans]
MSDTPVTPYEIDVPQSAIADLQTRLAATRLPDPLPGDDWDTGVPISVLREHVARWQEHDWAATQDRLNALPHFTTTVEDQVIHFVHVRCTDPDAAPVLLVHGWPGSFLEFEGLIERLSDSFHLVIPSLPGFGFSTPLTSGGWTSSRIAGAFVEIMQRLGYDRYVVQGGDLGAGIAPDMGRLAPDAVAGVHVNGALGGFVSEVDDTSSLTELEQDRLRRVGEFQEREIGYISIQSTRPALIGAMAADSPVAQLAWILDKLHAWTWPADTPAGDVLGDFVLDNVSLYWFTRTAGSAAFVGYAQGGDWGETPVSSGVPTAAIQFAHDIGLRSSAEESNRIVRWTDVEDRGGHFAALEEPDLMVADLREFIDSMQLL